MQLWIGCSGWQYPEWKGNFYLKNLPVAKQFEYYASKFNTVEINYTHYRNITEKNVQLWFKQAPYSFKYSIKVHRLLTHYKKMKNTQEMLKIFYSKLEILQDKLGCVLFQFPANFDYTKERLENILQQMDPSKTNVLEFRHSSWWQDNIIKTCNANHVIFSNVDAPGLPNHYIDTGKNFYCRFHGKPLYRGNYSDAELETWAKTLRQHKVKTAWAYFNNTAHGNAPHNALVLRRLLEFPVSMS